MIKSLFYIAIILISGVSFSQSLGADFQEKTLRLDYIFTGNKNHQSIALDELSSYPDWWGKRINLNKNLLRGDAEINIYKVNSDVLIYTQSFSTLFQEWLTTEEAQNFTKSFEGVCLVPFPTEKVKIEVILYSRTGKVIAKLTHTVDPNDILIHAKGETDVTKYKYLQKAKNQTNAINVVFVAEGYKKSEMSKFRKKSKKAIEQILKHKPFDKYKDYFNFIAVESVSKESGVSVPKEGIWKKTVLGSNFDTFYSDRYLTTKNVKQLHDVLAGTPYNHIIILANTDVYGGGGIYNSYTLTTTNNPNFEPVVVHEFGHSFAGLADEYFYHGDALSDFVNTNAEPWEKNITTLVDFESKWQNLLERDVPVPTPRELFGQYPIGVYQGTKGRKVYTGDIDCRMKTNQAHSFCLVCQDAIEQLIKFYVGM